LPAIGEQMKGRCAKQDWSYSTSRSIVLKATTCFHSPSSSFNRCSGKHLATSRIRVLRSVEELLWGVIKFFWGSSAYRTVSRWQGLFIFTQLSRALKVITEHAMRWRIGFRSLWSCCSPTIDLYVPRLEEVSIANLNRFYRSWYPSVSSSVKIRSIRFLPSIQDINLIHVLLEMDFFGGN
jgi:hypothetical protein